MRLSAPSFSAFLALSTVVVEASSSPFDTAKFKPRDIIRRDVAVIGGGSSGTYAALGLKDAGKSVIVVEKKGRIGGHANTYTDPETGIPLDMGIVILHNITEVHDFFRRFNLPLSPFAEGFFTSNLYFDFRTGKPVTPTLTPTPAEIGAAFTKYLQQYNKYPGLANGTFLASPVPEELYMPFGKFVKKYGIEAAVPVMYFYNPGSGDLLSNPVIEQFRYWSPEMVGGAAAGFISPVSRNMSEIFARAQAELSSDSSLLLSSEVVKSERPSNNSPVKLIVRTPTGQKLIIAKKLVMAIPPKVDYLAPFDLNANEKSVFSKYINAGYYVAAMKKSGFFENASISNAAEGSPYDLPVLPAAYSISASRIPGVQLTTYSTPQTSKSEPLSAQKVKAELINTAKRIHKQNPDIFGKTNPKPDLVAFHDHSPYYLQFPAAEIKKGIYDKLYALQGQRNTHWTGAAWKGEDSSLLWRYTKQSVIPRVLQGL